MRPTRRWWTPPPQSRCKRTSRRPPSRDLQFLSIGVSRRLRAMPSISPPGAQIYVTLTGSASTTQSNGMRINGGTPTLDHVTAIAGDTTNSHGILVFSGVTATLDSVIGRSVAVSANSSGLIVAGVSSITARNSVFTGQTRGVSVFLNSVANLVSSQLDGGIDNAGTANCVGSYDGNFALLDTDCTALP